MVKSALTPLTFAGDHGASYAMAVFDYGGRAFDHWDNGSTARARTVTLSGSRVVTACFKVPTLAIGPASGIGGTPVTATCNRFSLGSSVTVMYEEQMWRLQLQTRAACSVQCLQRRQEEQEPTLCRRRMEGDGRRAHFCWRSGRRSKIILVELIFRPSM